MTILHIRIKSSEEVITIDRGIHAQNFTLKRVSVVKNPNAVGTGFDYKGGVSINLDFMKGGKEILSNVNSNEINIAFDQNQTIACDKQYDLNFNTEDINGRFVAKVSNFNKSATPVFNEAGTTGELFYIDLYFQFSSLFQYNRY